MYKAFVDKDFSLEELGELEFFESGWSEASCNVLEEIARVCYQRAEAHREKSKNAKAYHLFLSIPSAVCAALAGGLAFYEKEEGTLTGMLALTSSTLSAVSAIADFGRKRDMHALASAEYQKLVGEIYVQLSLPPERRSDVEVLLSGLNLEIAHIRSTAPLI